MRTKLIYAALAAILSASCSNELTEATQQNETSETSKLNLVLSMPATSRAGFTPKTEWQTNDKIGLFLYKSSGWGEDYPRNDDSEINNESTKTTNGWEQTSPIYLLSERGTIWTYYPYNSNATDGTKIPVPINVNTHIDYMWGKSTNQVCVGETDAIIPMKHALSQFVVRLKVSPEYHNDGVLTSAKLKSTAAKFGINGTMNLNNNGKITFSPTETELSWAPNTVIPVTGQPAVDFAAAVYPMTLKTGEVTLEVVIDNFTYTYSIPQITWEAGKRYIYSITMQSNSVEIGGENGQSITIEDWTSSESDITLTPVK